MAVVSETRNIKEFNEIALTGQGEIFLEQGERDTLTIETEESILSKIKSEVQGQRLILGRKNWLDWMVPENTPIQFRITARQIRLVSISGAGSLYSRSIVSDRLSLEISGSGLIQIEHIETGLLQSDVSGSAKMELSGKAQKQLVHISGTGTLEALKLETQTIELHVSGSALAQIHAVHGLTVDISGVAEVRYLGQPELVQKISGAGRIEPYKPKAV